VPEPPKGTQGAVTCCPSRRRTALLSSPRRSARSLVSGRTEFPSVCSTNGVPVRAGLARRRLAVPGLRRPQQEAVLHVGAATQGAVGAAHSRVLGRERVPPRRRPVAADPAGDELSVCLSVCQWLPIRPVMSGHPGCGCELNSLAPFAFPGDAAIHVLRERPAGRRCSCAKRALAGSTKWKPACVSGSGFLLAFRV
jgi:hypothetical protein